MQLLASAAALVATFMVIVVPAARPCTSFLMDHEGRQVMAKSYDWDVGAGLVIANKRGVAKTALVLGAGDQPASWTSLYASLTFNQYGRELPISGMNDAGLAVETLVLSSTQYPVNDGRPALNELQWVQHALDVYADVAELVADVSSFRISSIYAKVHYLACDASGACATLEFLDGELVAHSGDELTVSTLANSTYADSIAFLAQHVGFGGSEPIPQGSGSLQRFVRATSLVAAGPAGDLPAAPLSVLDSVWWGSLSMGTQWNLVYDLGAKRVWFRTAAQGKVKQVDLGDFPADCTDEVEVLDIDHDAEGDVRADFAPYTMEANLAVIEEAFAEIADYLPPGAANLVAIYPDTTECVGEPVPPLPDEAGPPDAGPATPDTYEAPDPGAAGTDDAAVGAPDAGPPAPPGGGDDSGCAATPAASPWLLLLLLPLLVRRRFAC